MNDPVTVRKKLNCGAKSYFTDEIIIKVIKTKNKVKIRIVYWK